jgi:hypothetical protein
VEGAKWFAGLGEMSVEVSSAVEGFIKEDLCEAVCLLALSISS